ncbi:MAG: FadR/GntR family transcriptional regulator [Sciscionella sp.]
MTQVRALIRDGQLTPGARLPAERDLCERFGVSRVTVREALRILEASGLVAIKVGARGGAFITSPSSDRVGRGIEDYLTLSPSITASEVTEARFVLELGIVPIVCQRATEEDIEELLALCDRADKAVAEDRYTMDMSAEFHVRVAQLAHNRAIAMLLHPFHGPLLHSMREAREVAPVMGVRGVKEHRRFVEAVRARDVGKATEVMRTHLERTAARVRPKRPRTK